MRRDSQTVSGVAQGIRIALMSGCDVKITAAGIYGDHQSMFELLVLELHELALRGQNALVSCPFNSVVPLFIPTHNMVRLTKGTVIGVISEVSYYGNIYIEFAKTELQKYSAVNAVSVSVNVVLPQCGVDAVNVTNNSLRSADMCLQLHNDRASMLVVK